MIEMRKLRDLVKLMKENDLIELDLRDETQTVTLRRPGPQAPVPPPVVQPAAPAPPAAPPGPAGGAAAGHDASADAAGAEGPPPGTVEIPSPMVGTFYNSPSPDADPFVRGGAKVEPETVVCIIEAMKVFNEIKAEVTGTIDKVLVDNGQAVEFGQPLFRVRSA